MRKNLALTDAIQVTNSTSLQVLANRFVEYLDISALTVKSYKAGVRKFLSYLAENGIANPNRETILEYKKALSAKYTAGSVALYLSALRRFFSWCECEGLYPNITNGIKSPKISHEHKRDAFSANELQTIISGMNRNSLEDKRNYAIFVLISSCGLRTVEVARADIGDLHRVAGITVLNIQGKGKSEKSDFVKLSEPVECAIREYLNARGEVSDNEPLFASCSRRNKGKRLTTRTISGVCKSAMRNGGFNSRRLTAHSLRHSAITLALLGGMRLDDVSAFARHSSISVTQIYNHSINRMKSLCEATVTSAIFGVKARNI